MPEPRKRGEYKGLPFDKRTVLLGGKRIAPTDATPAASPSATPSPAAPTPPDAPERPSAVPWDNGGLHVGCPKGGRFKNLAVGASAGRRCRACGQEWRWLRAEKRWERVE